MCAKRAQVCLVTCQECFWGVHEINVMVQRLLFSVFLTPSPLLSWSFWQFYSYYSSTVCIIVIYQVGWSDVAEGRKYENFLSLRLFYLYVQHNTWKIMKWCMLARLPVLIIQVAFLFNTYFKLSQYLSAPETCFLIQNKSTGIYLGFFCLFVFSEVLFSADHNKM